MDANMVVAARVFVSVAGGDYSPRPEKALIQRRALWRGGHEGVRRTKFRIPSNLVRSVNFYGEEIRGNLFHTYCEIILS